MKVNLTTFGLEPPDSSKTPRAGQAGPAAGGASGTTGLDRARFSFDQARVQSLAAQVLAQPEMRAAKIQALQQVIGNGEYAVPAGKIADALINEWGAGQNWAGE
jgi:flagellar biosynthesis anti-sigma factor FlgM